MGGNQFKFIEKCLKIFEKTESLFSLVLSFLLAIVLVTFLVRIVELSYVSIFSKIASPDKIQSDDITAFFGRIITLLIVKEFMNSIVSFIKKTELSLLVRDVILITGLSILRKIIIIDFINVDSLHIIALGVVLIGLGIYYVFINPKIFEFFKKKRNEEPMK